MDEVSPVVAPNVPPAVQMNPEELAAKYQEFQNNQWNQAGDAERARIAKERGLLNDPSVTLSPVELRELIPLEGDTMRYAKGKDGLPRIATTRHGMLCWPKPKGRKKPHMTKHAMAIKSRAISTFRGLFASHAANLEQAAKAAGEPFNGVPTADLSKLAARASILATGYNKRDAKAARITRRNMQKLSRRINAGVVNGNTNVVRYIG